MPINPSTRPKKANLKHKVEGGAAELQDVGKVVEPGNDDQELLQVGQVAPLDQVTDVQIVQGG